MKIDQPIREKKNVCVSLLRNEKKEYFANLNEKNITDNKKLSSLFCQRKINLGKK